MKPACLLVFLVALTGCGPLKSCSDAGKKPIVFVDISGEDDGLDRPQLEAALREVMDELPGFAFRNAKDGETKWQLDAKIQFVNRRDSESGAGVHRSAGIRLRLFALGATPGPRKFSTDLVHAEDSPATVTPTEFVAIAVGKAGQELNASLAMYEASPADVVLALSSTSERVRARAVLVAQDRKLMDAFDRLVEMVQDEDESPEVVLRAIGALVELGDSRAAPALIKAGRRKNSAYVSQVVYAVGQLGGREAQAYLFTVSSGHPDPALRMAAKEALQELEGRLTTPEP